MSTVRGSLLLSSASSYVGLVLGVISTMIIARVLTPLEIGIFAVAAVFATLASTFRDFGVAEFLIQKRDLQTSDLKACFAVNLGTSWAVGMLLLLCAPLGSSFYNDTGIGSIMRVQALNFFLIPFGAVTFAWFRREMNFTPIFHASIAANSLQFVVSVGLALNGYSYMSLAWASFAGVAVTVLVSILHRPKWFPRWPGLEGIREVINFGTFASGVFVANRLARGAPELTLGKISSLGDAGMYSRASGLVEMFERLVGQAVEQVCLPYMANGVKETGSVVPNLSVTTTLVTGVGWPFACFLGLCAYPAIRILYGTQWMAAVPVAQILCAALVAQLLFRFASEALFSLGKAREANRLQFTHLGLRLIGLTLVVPFGLIGAAWGFVCAAVLGTFVSQRALSKAAGYTWRHTWAACKSSMLVTFLSCAPYAIVVALWTPAEDNYLRHAALGGILTVTGWLLATRALRHPIWPEVTRVAASLAVRLQGLRGKKS